MKIIAQVAILCENPRELYALLEKEYLTDLVPMVGMDLDDPPWSQPRQIEHVEVNPRRGTYHVLVRNDVREDKEACKEAKEVYLENGWKDLRSGA